MNNLDLQVNGIGTVSAPLQVVLLLTLLSFLPAILVTMTSFTRITIIFHFLRQALGTQETPSNQILVGLSLFLTMFIMAPVGARINELAVEPAVSGKVSMSQAVSLASPPLRDFMLKQTREADLGLFIELSKVQKPKTPAELPMTVVIPASYTDGAEAPFPRLSLNLPALVQTKEIVLVISGAAKRAVLARVLAGEGDLPVGRLIAAARCPMTIFWSEA